MTDRDYQICTNCVMDTSDPQIVFDDNGRCDFCTNYYDVILPSWHTGAQGERELSAMAEKIRASGKDKSYDCIIGLSGGVDSSYLAHIAVTKMNLRPLVIVVDTGWNLNVAVTNIERVVKGLSLDLITEVINWKEMRDLQLSFLKSSVPYQDLPQDQVIFAPIYFYAAKHGIKYILTGANYSTECVKPPQEWTYYNDKKMILDIQRRFGTIPLKDYPLCSMLKKRFWFRYIQGIKELHPLNNVKYDKEAAIAELHDAYGWERYDNKHYENVFTRFYEGWWLPQKFGYDKRRCYFSSEILTGQMTRDDALEQIASPAYDEKLALKDMEYIAKKLCISVEEMQGFLASENKTFRDYKNNYRLVQLAIRAAKALGVEKRNFR